MNCSLFVFNKQHKHIGADFLKIFIVNKLYRNNLSFVAVLLYPILTLVILNEPPISSSLNKDSSSD